MQYTFIGWVWDKIDRLCGLMVRVPGYNLEVRVRFPALPDFLRRSGPATGSAQTREWNWLRSYLEEKVAALV
jgi:hypothetical protein